MRDPFASETYGGKDVRMGNTSGFDDVLPCFEVPPEIRIGDGLSGEGKDEGKKNKNEQPVVRLKRPQLSLS